MMTTTEHEKTTRVPVAFSELFNPYRYKIFYGGRGGAKSYAFAAALLLYACQGHERVLCAREIQNSIRDSVKRLLDDRIDALGLRRYFISTDSEIRCPHTNSSFIFTGLRISPDRIKSYEGVTKVWVEEAETISERSLDILIPTIRAHGSELWFSFNPDRLNAPIYQKFVVKTPPPNSYVKKVSWRDNPWFPEELRLEMLDMKKNDPDKWLHIWEGEPVKVSKGSYYGKLLSNALNAGRITTVPYEPSLLVHTAWDLGITDSTAIWFFQVVNSSHGGSQYRIIDYYENCNCGLQHYISVLNSRDYEYGQHIVPHDAKVREYGSGKTRVEIAAEMGVRFQVCPNIGVQDGIDYARGIIKKAYFDRVNCERGLECLWSYQREWNEKLSDFEQRPLHDWTSHAADAFRYLAVGFRNPIQRAGAAKPQYTVNRLAGRT